MHAFNSRDASLVFLFVSIFLSLMVVSRLEGHLTLFLLIRALMELFTFPYKHAIWKKFSKLITKS